MLMRLANLTIICLMFSLGCSGQKQNFSNKIDSLRTITTMPYYPELSGDMIFWDLTKEKADIVPSLIDRITDTTETKANVPNFGGVYTIGDICVRAIEEIIKDFPTIKLIETDPKLLKEKAYGIYWGYVRSDFKNRVELKKRVKKWYDKNKNNLIWQQDDRLYSVSDDESSEMKRRPAGGYFVIKK